MFCTSLRRRLAFTTAVPTLIGQPLALRESQLNTHDIEILFEGSRHLRVLLFASSEAKDDNLDEVMSRIQHFASLTGGHDLIIVFLLSTPPAASFVSARHLNSGADSDTTNVDAMRSYSRLQAAMINHPELPYIPILPLATLEGLSALLQKHVDQLLRQRPAKSASGTSFELLQHCTANPPMSQQTAYILSDLFPNLKELAKACSSVTLAPNSSSPSARVMGNSSQLMSGSDVGLNMSTQSSYFAASKKLKRLRDLVGDQVCQDIIDFWREEWVIE